MEDKLKYTALAGMVVCCLVYFITTIIAMNCLADKKIGCAQASGLTALVTCFFGAGLLWLGLRQ